MKKKLLFLLLTLLVLFPLSVTVNAVEIVGEQPSVVGDAAPDVSLEEEALPDAIWAWIETNRTDLLVVASFILTGIVAFLNKKGLSPVIALITALIKKLFGSKDEPGILAKTEQQNSDNRQKIVEAAETMKAARDEITKAAESCNRGLAVMTYTAMAVKGFEEILRTLIHAAAYPDYQKDKLERLLDETKAYTDSALSASSGVSVTAVVEGETDEKLD